MKAKKVLIYRLGSLGDTIVVLPCLHLIARTFPDAERFILTSASGNPKAASISSILGCSGLVNGYITYQYKKNNITELRRLHAKIKQWKPDILIYLPGQRAYWRVLRDIYFFKSCGIKKIIGIPYSRDLRNNRLLSGNFEQEASRLARCISVLGGARVEEMANWDLLLSKEEYDLAAEILDPWPGKNRFIVSSIGTKFQTNDWGNENWAKLFKESSHKYSGWGLVLIGSDDEAVGSEELRRHWAGPFLNLCGKVSPRIASAVIKRARLFLGHDSGPMHLAASAGTPCIGIFGARNKPAIWFPCGDRHQIIYHKTDCFGCGLDICKKYGKKCIKSISVEEVCAKIQGMM